MVILHGDISIMKALYIRSLIIFWIFLHILAQLQIVGLRMTQNVLWKCTGCCSVFRIIIHQVISCITEQKEKGQNKKLFCLDHFLFG